MNLAQRDRLSELVEELTTSGESQLNQDKMKEIKKICKISNDYIEHFFHLIMTQLGQEHAEIRLSAFQLAGELFCRSHHFRTLLVSNFQEFLELTVETDSENPLPPPKEVARKLKTLAIKTVQAWHASYGEAYKKLSLGYHFLKQVKKVDFHDIQARTLAERRREDEREKRMSRIYKEKVEKTAKEMEEYCAEIEESVTEMNTCLKLLLPDHFDLCDLQTSSNGASTANNTSALLPSVANCEKRSTSAGDEDQPCCSKDLVVIEDISDKVKINDRTKNEENQSLFVKEKERYESKKESVPELGSNNDDEKGMEKEVEGSEGEKESAKEDSDLEEATNEDNFIRFTGLISHRYNLDLTLSSDLFLEETDDNEAIVTTVRDLYTLMNRKHLPAVQSWVKVLTKAGGQQQLLRKALDLKERVDNTLKKHQDLHIDYKTRRRRVMKASADGGDDEDDDEDDDDFEEVLEKEGYEPHIPEHLREEYGLDPHPSTCKDDGRKMVSCKTQAARVPAHPLPGSSQPSRSRKALDEQDPTCAAATLHILKNRLQQASGGSGSSVKALGDPTNQTSGPSGSDNSGSSQEKVCAPVVPFGLDLYYWGQEQPGAKIIKSASQHQFWVPCEVEEEVENKELSAQMKARYISFPGHFTPVTHTCNAPLPSGALCQRQDRVKCPFHGVIIPRGELGQPTNSEDRARLEREERQRREERPDWRDPELMRDIEAATGEDLGSNKTFGRGKGKRKAQKKYPKLSDLKQSSNTSRSRLEKKVFNKSSMRRVTEVMNKVDRRKHDKFSNQFNYALN